MNSFDEWFTDITGNDVRFADKILKEAYNAGMERAAVIASNVKAPFSRFTIAAKIRNEIEK